MNNKSYGMWVDMASTSLWSWVPTVAVLRVNTGEYAGGHV